MKEVCRIYGLYSKVNNTKGVSTGRAMARNDAIKVTLSSCAGADVVRHTRWS